MSPMTVTPSVSVPGACKRDMQGRTTIPRGKSWSALGVRGSDSLRPTQPCSALLQLALREQSRVGSVHTTDCKVLF